MFARWDFSLPSGHGPQYFAREASAFQMLARQQQYLELARQLQAGSHSGVPSAPAPCPPSRQNWRQPPPGRKAGQGDLHCPPPGGPASLMRQEGGAPARPMHADGSGYRPADADPQGSAAMMIDGRGNSLRFGSGDDRLSVEGGEGHAALMGPGNDRVSLRDTTGMVLDAGAGDDVITGEGVRNAWIDPGTGRNRIAMSGDGIRVDASKGANMILLAGDDNLVDGAGSDDFIVKLTRGWEGFRFA